MIPLWKPNEPRANSLPSSLKRSRRTSPPNLNECRPRINDTLSEPWNVAAFITKGPSEPSPKLAQVSTEVRHSGQAPDCWIGRIETRDLQLANNVANARQLAARGVEMVRDAEAHLVDQRRRQRSRVGDHVLLRLRQDLGAVDARPG